jgi:SAM-dependent MidA family methyltransferase
MEMVLYEPGLGYYSGGLQKFGEQGDFITAPEVSSLFGQCLARQVAEIFLGFEEEGDRNIIEFGAGSGVLAADMLLALESSDSLPARYYILELSAELKERQLKTIETKASHLVDRIHWLDELSVDVAGAVVIANEVLDAMPVECFRMSASGPESLMVGFVEDKLVSRYSSTEGTVDERLMQIEKRSEINFSEAYRSELNPSLSGWLTTLSGCLDSMVMLLIDYGYNEKEYYHPDRSEGTLMCYYRHRAHDDYFWYPGLQDITAYVNFTDVAYAATESGFSVSGYTTQAAFLLANGLSELHATQVTDDVKTQVRLSQQIKTLTLPSEMGERFKVMALTKNFDESLSGFSMLDLRNRL